MRLAENTGHKKSPKIRHWAPLHKFVGLYLCNSGTYRQLEKKLVKQQYLCHMSLQYGELQPTEIVLLVWGPPANFNGSHVLAALLHVTLVVGVGETFLR